MTVAETHIQAARRRLEKAALQYARMKCFGATLEERQLNDGTWVESWILPSFDEVSMLEAHLLKALGNEAVALCRELTAVDLSKVVVPLPLHDESFKGLFEGLYPQGGTEHGKP